MSVLVECVPNFSEGRDQAVIAQIVAAAAGYASVLDVNSDRDHNRSVLTIAGAPEIVVEAAFAAAAAAVRLIDLEHHEGVHPRIGAADVIPLVPLRGISLEECAALARGLGKRIGEELKIPVYMYEAAAYHPDRADLSHIRSGGYEALKYAIGIDADRAPDYGPSFIGRAGATAVGARMPLIAFNVYLDTADVKIAHAIARAIRASNGGLPHVKALGLLVDGQAQVSMNLTDYRRTGLYSVMQAVTSRAAAHGTAVRRGELIGLVPQAALLDLAAAALKLPPNTPSFSLEARFGDQTGDYRPFSFDE